MITKTVQRIASHGKKYKAYTYTLSCIFALVAADKNCLLVITVYWVGQEVTPPPNTLFNDHFIANFLNVTVKGF